MAGRLGPRLSRVAAAMAVTLALALGLGLGACGSDAADPPADAAEAVVLRYETSSRTKDHSADVELVVHADGRLFVAFGGARLPAEPARVLPRAEVAELERRLVDEGYADLASPQVDPQVEDGMDRILTATFDGKVRTLRFEGVSRPLLDDLQSLASSM